MNAASWIASVGVALSIFALVAQKAPGVGVLVILIGGALALIGYLQRVLFALENKPGTHD